MNPNRREMIRTCGQGLLALPLLSQVSLGADTSKTPIKIGQIGIGHAHANKLGVYRKSKDYEVVGIVENDPQLRKQLSSNPAYKDVPVMTQEQLLNVPGLQAVLVETEVRDLLGVAETCIQAGKHVHLDKPAGESFQHYNRILKLASENKLMVQMGYMYRYNPAILLLQECLKKGWLGEVFEIHTVMSKVIQPELRSKLGEYPGGLMFELGCHIIDLVIGVLGKPNHVTPYAQHASKIKDNLVDNMLAVFEYPNALATVKTTGMEVDGFARRHFVVCGTEGTFHIQPLDRPSARVTFSKEHKPYKKGYQDIKFPKFPRYVADAADMAKVIRGEKEADFSYDHDLTVQKSVLEASHLSLKK